MPTVNFKYLLMSLVIMMFGVPMIGPHIEYPVILEIVFGTSLLFGLLSLSAYLKEYMVGIILVVLALMFSLIAIFSSKSIFTYLMIMTALMFFIQMILFSIHQVFILDRVDINKIIGAVCIYILLALLWAIIFMLIEILSPGSFSGISSDLKHHKFSEFLYFSIVTLTTLGYGDVTPISPFARMVALLETIVGVFYIAILVATLVGNLITTKMQSSNED